MVTETTARQWVVTTPATDTTKPPVEVARVDTVENSKAIVLRFGKQSVSIAPEAAKDVADALVRASGLAVAPVTAVTPPAPPTPA